MSRSAGSAWAILTLAVLFVPAAIAGTEVVNVQVGASFGGTIDSPGAMVEIGFSAVEGSNLKLAVQAKSGASLRPTVLVKDASGTPLPGTSGSIDWLPVGNVIHYFSIPSTGQYFAEISGSSGSGAFTGKLTGGTGQVPSRTLSGTVTSSLTGAPLAGVSVLVGGNPFATTDGTGAFTGQLLAGSYTVKFIADGFKSQTLAANLSSAAAQLNVALMPLVPVQVDTSVSGDMTAGGSVGAAVVVLVPQGSSVDSVTWSQSFGVDVIISDPTSETPTITLPDLAAFRDHLIHVLTEPPVTQAQLPENVQIPPGEFPAGLQDRFQVVGINPFSLEEAGLVRLEVEVETDLGTFTDEVEIHVPLPFKVSTGLRNVAVGIPVLLHAKEQAGYSWFLDPPPGSLAELTDADTRNPYFTPDVKGLYTVEAFGGPPGGEPLATIEVFAGTWRGIIVDQDIDGRPVIDTACTLCHSSLDGFEAFTDWPETGHAEIFTNNLNTNTHYSSNCFSCHTVGYDPGVDNGGVDEQADYQAFLNAGLLNHPGDNWTTLLEQFPDTARMANAQCESCHGPQVSVGHGLTEPAGTPRASISSDVCATCHGEPLRHARFQQWQLSAHANYELAIDESQSGSCSRCHTGNGFLEWLPILLDDDPETDPSADIAVTWSEDEAHPQTCATCHDPHAEGTTSGDGSNATVRISGDTPPLIAGFTATDVGRGAICMTCHNSRRGLYNDAVYDSLSASDRTRAPHGSAQADVLMGQNAFLVEVGDPGGHATTGDSCVDCHMEATPPPDILAYNQGGTNHTFFASPDICGNCHSPFLQAEDVQDSVDFLLHQVEALIEDGWFELMVELIDDGNTIALGDPDDDPPTIEDEGDIQAIVFGESRGRQAIDVTLAGVGEVGLVGVNSITVLNGETELGSLHEFAGDELLKSGWNWVLVHNDGSLGVHNPFFAIGALIASRDALASAGAPQPGLAPSVDRQRLSERIGNRDGRVRARELREARRADDQ